MIPRYYVVAEATHEIQNPTSEEKLLLLGRRLGLGPDSRVLDIASGRGGPAVLLASEFGCTWHGIEISPDFHAVAVERAADAGLGDRLSFELADAATATHEPESYDAALCLGASFVYGSLADTVEALTPAVRPGGHIVVGEPFWRRLPLPDDYEDRTQPWTTLEGTVRSSRPQAYPSSPSSRRRRTTGIATRPSTGRRSRAGSRRTRATRTRRRSASRGVQTQLPAPPARVPRLGDLRRLEAVLARE